MQFVGWWEIETIKQRFEITRNRESVCLEGMKVDLNWASLFSSLRLGQTALIPQKKREWLIFHQHLFYAIWVWVQNILPSKASWTIQSNSDIHSCFLNKNLPTTCVKKTHAGQVSFFNFKVSRNPTEAIVLRQHRLLSVALIFDFVPNIKPATWSDCRNLGH